MNDARLEQIVQAVLYEGYVLYPYRPSSKKNCRERFTFGRVYPEIYSAAQNGAEPCLMQTECLVQDVEHDAAVQVTVRFLHPLAREVCRLERPLTHWDPHAELEFSVVPELNVGGEFYQTWLEAVEREIKLPPLLLSIQTGKTTEFPFHFAGMCSVEPLRATESDITAVLRRTQPAITGIVEIGVTKLQPQLAKITVRVRNTTALAPGEVQQAEAVTLRTLASTHTILCGRNAHFVSLMDPPAELKSEADACRNIGTWPVLAGDEAKAERDTVLSSPIILYDYPQVAPESAGPLFDGTEIDEILTLRILTLTDAEKFEMRRVDEQARRLLERTEALPGEALLRMHGTIRDRGPVAPGTTSGEPVDFDDFFGPNTRLQGITIGGVYVQPGDRVRLHPKARADVLDLALADQVAVVEAVEQDLEKRIHLAVVLENDPGKDLGLLRQPGHRFFYGVDEVEPLVQTAREGAK